MQSWWTLVWCFQIHARGECVFTILMVYTGTLLRIVLVECGGLFMSPAQHQEVARHARPSSAMAGLLYALMVSSGPLAQEVTRKHTNSFLPAYYCASRVMFPKRCLQHYGSTFPCRCSGNHLRPRPSKESGQTVKCGPSTTLGCSDLQHQPPFASYSVVRVPHC